jgi:hypothetical protein
VKLLLTRKTRTNKRILVSALDCSYLYADTNLELESIEGERVKIEHFCVPLSKGLFAALEALSLSEMDQDFSQVITDVLPAKRVRKQTDKEMKSNGPQWAPKVSKPNYHKHKNAAPPAPPPPPVLNSNVFIPPSVALSTYDKASQLTLSKDQLICHGCEVS